MIGTQRSRALDKMGSAWRSWTQNGPEIARVDREWDEGASARCSCARNDGGRRVAVLYTEREGTFTACPQTEQRQTCAGGACMKRGGRCVAGTCTERERSCATGPHMKQAGKSAAALCTEQEGKRTVGACTERGGRCAAGLCTEREGSGAAGTCTGGEGSCAVSPHAK